LKARLRLGLVMSKHAASCRSMKDGYTVNSNIIYWGSKPATDTPPDCYWTKVTVCSTVFASVGSVRSTSWTFRAAGAKNVCCIAVQSMRTRIVSGGTGQRNAKSEASIMSLQNSPMFFQNVSTEIISLNVTLAAGFVKVKR